MSHQFNLWRLNRDDHSLSILEIPAFEAPKSSLFPGGDSFIVGQESSDSEAQRGNVFIVHHREEGEDDDGEEEDDGDFFNFFDPAKGRPMFPIQADSALPDPTVSSLSPSTTTVPPSNEFAPEAVLPIPLTQKPLGPARLVELQSAPYITLRRPHSQTPGKDEWPVDEEFSHEVPTREEPIRDFPPREAATHADDAVLPMQSQTLSRGTFSCQITDVGVSYVQGLEPLGDVRDDPLAAKSMGAALEKRALCRGWAAKLEWVPIIVENKKLPKWGTLYSNGEVNPHALVTLTRKAQQQVLKQVCLPTARIECMLRVLNIYSVRLLRLLSIQAAYFFTNLRWRHQKELVAIAAVGDWWTWTVVTLTSAMEQRREDDHDSAEAEPLDYEPDESTLQHTEWVTTRRYGTTESCEEMTKLRTWLKKFVENANNAQA